MWYKDVKKGFGLTLKQWRGTTGISQEELAWRAGLHRSYVADIERGARNASLQSIEKLASALRISLSTLFQPLDQPPGPTQGAGTATSNHPVDILLVEDDPHDVELTLKAFRQAHLTNHLDVVTDGAQALDFLLGRGAFAKRKVAERPLMMLLDLNLPKVHGLEVLRRLKADRRTRRTRVVVLTMSREDEHISSARDLGAEAYIVKPVDFHRFTEVTPSLDFAWTLRPASTRRRVSSRRQGSRA